MIRITVMKAFVRYGLFVYYNEGSGQKQSYI